MESHDNDGKDWMDFVDCSVVVLRMVKDTRVVCVMKMVLPLLSRFSVCCWCFSWLFF